MPRPRRMRVSDPLPRRLEQHRTTARLSAGPAPRICSSLGRGSPTAVARSRHCCYGPAVQLLLAVPSVNNRGPQYMEQALAAIHQANPGRLPLALEFRTHGGRVVLACRFPEELHAAMRGQLYAAYPDARLDHVEEQEVASPEHQTWTAHLHLRHHLFPMRRYPQFEDALNRVSADPLSALLLTLAPEKNDRLYAQIVIEAIPARPRWRYRAEKSLHRLATPFFRRHHRLAHLYGDWTMSPHISVRAAGLILGRLGGRPEQHTPGLTTSPDRQHAREDELQAAADKITKHLFEVDIRLTVVAPPEDGDRARAKLREMAGAFGQFSIPRLAHFHAVPTGRFQRRPRFLLSTEELATLWHPPTQTVRAPALGSVESREMEPPVHLPGRQSTPDLAILGQAVYRGSQQRFGILQDDRRRHVALVGKTGQGKTTLLQHLITSDIRSGRGVALLDPHGDLCEAVLAAVPAERTNDVILFDPADRQHPLSFNLLHCPEADMRPLAASGVLSAFKKLYGEFWGPRMEHIFRNALLALLETPGTTLLSVLRLLSDVKFRQPLVAKLKDPVVRRFWQYEFAAMPKKLQIEAISPIQNKVGAFVSSPVLRNILGQTRSSLDLRSVLDDGKVLLVNLSKGRLGDDVSSLLGSFLVTALQLAAMRRADVAEAQRQDFFLYVDEFQNVATESFATILSEARKYRLALTVANQYLGQLDDATAAALWGNVGTLVSFQVGAADAEIIATQLGGDLTPQDLLRLPRYHAYARLLIEGAPSLPFSMRTLPPARANSVDRTAIIRRTSQHRYSRPAETVEREITAALAA